MTSSLTMTNEQLAAWLVEHRTALLDLWRRHAPNFTAGGEAGRIFSLLYDGIVGSARENPELLDRLLTRSMPALAAENATVDFPTLIELPFRFRQGMAELLTELDVAPAQALGLLMAADPILERTVLTLSRAYSAASEEELREQVQQAELLANHQALLAEEADRAALRVAMLYETGRSLSASLNRAELLQTLGTQIQAAIELEQCAIWTYESDGSLTMGYAAGPLWGVLEDIRLPAEAQPSALREALGQRSPTIADVEDQKQHGTWSIPGSCLVYLPLYASDTLLACVVLQHSDSSFFGREELQFLAAIGNQAAVALENAHLYTELQSINVGLEQKVAERTHELREERDRLRTLFEIGHYISGTLEIDDLLQRTLEALSRITGGSHGSVLLLEHETGHLVDRAALREGEYLPGFLRFQVGEGIAGWIAENREPSLVDDIHADPRWVPDPTLQGDGMRKHQGSLVGVPLVASGDLLGVLMLSHPNKAHFNNAHLELLNAIAGEIAIAIYNAQLYGYLTDRAERLGMMSRRYEVELTKINAILQSLADGVIVSSPSGEVILANVAAERILDRPLDELISMGMSLNALLTGLKLDEPTADPVDDLLRQPQNSDGSQRTLSGTMVYRYRTLSVLLSPVQTEAGEVLGTVAILRDITKEVEADRVKTEFIATVSHELRTPMTSIKGYTQLLSMGSLGQINDVQRQFLTTISTNAERMISIINDLLDITKVETGNVDLVMESVQVAEVIATSVAEVQEFFRQRNQTLTIDMATGAPPLMTDRQRLKQVLNNLLSNAAKYTPNEGTITVTAASVKTADLPTEIAGRLAKTRKWVRIDVNDTGVGISLEEQDLIFERFYRTENPLKVEGGGTGLGLALVRGLINLLGGQIWVTSVIDEGSTFSVVLPAA